MQQRTTSIIKIITAILTIALCAQLTINVGPIPITGQTLAILCWAFFLTAKESAIAISLYLISGFVGAPIFADGAHGIEKLFGGSGGFLVGFFIAAYIVSYLYFRSKSMAFIHILLLTALGTAIILIVGVGRLILLFGFDKGLEYGLIPFWKGALIKILLGSLIVWGIKKLINKMGKIRGLGFKAI